MTELDRLSQDGRVHPLTVLESRQDSEVEIGGERFINLSSTNYLGLNTQPHLIEAATEAGSRALADRSTGITSWQDDCGWVASGPHIVVPASPGHNIVGDVAGKAKSRSRLRVGGRPKPLPDTVPISRQGRSGLGGELGSRLG